MAQTGPHAFSMTFRDGLFLHWPFDPADIDPLVPDPLDLDTRNGRAWVSIVSFVLADAGFRFTPRVTRLTVPELNLRTYVQLGEQSGLFFLSIDIASASVARTVRTATRLPVYTADIQARSHADRVTFRSVRQGDETARFSATYSPTGEVFRAEPGTVDHWLAERRRLYDPGTRGPGVLVAEISHQPWPLQSAEVTMDENMIFEATDLPQPADDPRIHYCERMAMTGSLPGYVS